MSKETWVSKPHLTKDQRLPRSYKEVEKILRDVKACKGSLKNVLYRSRVRGAVFNKVYSLAVNVLKNRLILDKILEETQLLQKEPFLRKELAGILVYELVFGKELPGVSKPVLIIKKYEDEIFKAYEEVKNDILLDSALQSLPRYIRVNTLLTSVSDVLRNLSKFSYYEVRYSSNTTETEYLDLVRELEPGNFLIDFHFKDLLVFASSENLSNWPLYQQGHVYIQDKSSYIPVHVLNPQPGSNMIDACAAPGMKTVHIAASMDNKGLIYAYEKDQNRFKVLQERLKFADVQICRAECNDFSMLNPSDEKFDRVEYILVDPSCSGSGMVSRMDTVTDTEESKTSQRVQNLAKFQIILLKHALRFPSAKRVVYSTCSITEEENEYVVHEALNHFRSMYKMVCVMPEWTIRGSDKYEFGPLCLRAYPDKTLTNGFFVAMFERLSYDEHLEMQEKTEMESDHAKPKKKNKKSKCVENNSTLGNQRKNVDLDIEMPDETEKLMFDKIAEAPTKSKSKKSREIYSQSLLEEDEFNRTFRLGSVENIDSNNPIGSCDSSSIVNTNKKKINKKRKQVEEIEVIDESAIDSFQKLNEDGIFDNNDGTNCIPKKKKRKSKFGECTVEPIFAEGQSVEIEVDVVEKSIKKKKKKHERKHSSVDDNLIVPQLDLSSNHTQREKTHSSNLLVEGQSVPIVMDMDESIIKKKKKKHKRTHSSVDHNLIVPQLDLSSNHIQREKTHSSNLLIEGQSVPIVMDMDESIIKKKKKKHKRTHSSVDDNLIIPQLDLSSNHTQREKTHSSNLLVESQSVPTVIDESIMKTKKKKHKRKHVIVEDF